MQNPARSGGTGAQARGGVDQRGKTRPTNIIRYTKTGPRHMKPQQTEFHIRTSVADLMMQELNSFDRCIFFQRVYILAKNIVQSFTAQSSAVSILSKYIQSKSSLSELRMDEGYGEELDEEDGIATELSELEIDDVSQWQGKSDGENAPTEMQGKQTLFKLTKEDFAETPKVKRKLEYDFFDQFKEHVEAIIKKCEQVQLSEDKFSGLFLCMGSSHTLFVLEGAEDTISQFCQELLLISENYFESMRVFLVEDKIEETFFEEFLYRRSVAMNINEKFPPPTANDPQLMASQHWLIKEKLRILCQTLSYELNPRVSVHTKDRFSEAFVPIIEDEIKEPTKRKRRLKPKRKKRLRHNKPVVTAVESQKIDEPEKNLESDEARLSDSKSYMGRESRGDLLQDSEREIAQKLDGEDPGLVSTMVSEIFSRKSEDFTIKRKSSIRIQAKPSVLGEDFDILEEVEEEEEVSKEPLNPFVLNPSVYNRLLPEIQRIELVLTSTRFYLTVNEFARFSQEIPMQNDEDALIWPTSYTYLPLNIFQRLPFDVNLTFGQYDAKETEEGDTDSSDEEEKGAAGGEGAKGETKEA